MDRWTDRQLGTGTRLREEHSMLFPNHPRMLLRPQNCFRVRRPFLMRQESVLGFRCLPDQPTAPALIKTTLSMAEHPALA